MKTTDALNGPLASACQAACAACCCKGKIFLPDAEYERIHEWIQENSVGDLEEFNLRSEALDGFHLYNQKDRCQFLDKQNLCRLHDKGIKPRECFWWPLHIYKGEDVGLEIRVSTSCCDAHNVISPSSPLVSSLKNEADHLGRELIRRFRDAYSGSYDGKLIERF